MKQTSDICRSAFRPTCRPEGRPTSRTWIIKTVIFLLCLIPLARLVWLGFHDGLGANPIEFITRSTGAWTLNFLLITLCVTPLRKLLNRPALLRYRRMLGLFAFFYAVLHFMTYLWLDQFFDWQAILKDIAKRPFITLGFSAFVLLIPLAVTSPKAMLKRLGRHWQTLHRAIYLIAILGVFHYLWLVKKDMTMPLIYMAILGILLLARVVRSKPVISR
ncbi:MAG: protein-methionine-sulfoxide reductase heme-binding subunit MsrQ [Sulfuricellaceae bacterium]|nr:protein-methionine-sulfoxide reductase heme-binding subunit MsrQ [Sulfuricellaceae bacterium]